MYNMMASAASPREQREQRGSSPRGQASNAAASRNRVKLYGCNVSWRFKKARYRQKNRMKCKDAYEALYRGLYSFRSLLLWNSYLQPEGFLPFPSVPNSNFRFLRSHLFRGGFEPKGRIYWHSRFRSCFNKTIYIFLYPRYINVSLKDRFLNVKINIKVDR